MKEMRRILALVMCVVMLVGYMPVSAHATGDTGAAAETPVVASDVPSEEPSSEASGETTEPETVAVTGITLNPTELVVPVDEPNMALTVTVLPENATDKTVTWHSSDSEVVSVDEYGTMSFHKEGKAVITATAGDFSATCNVTVGEAEPVVYANDSTACLDAAIFCSDVHGSTSDLTSVLGGVKTSGVDYSSIGFVGDTCLTVANTTSIVQSALSDTNISVMFSYASSHDNEDGADISTDWNYSGEVEGVSKYYLVYTICETDMQNDTTAEDNFTTWYSGLTDAEKKLPIFIMSHRPLHHRRKDNANATDWYNAISAAAKTSDITFFWAHNHTGETSVDTAAYYVAKNGSESITLGTTSSSGGETVYPNFTYMNAGYINANNQNPARLGVATTVQITANSLIFQDYNSDGKYTNSSYSHNVTVAREFATEAVTLESIAISGDTEYFVGDELNLTVTATYSDTTTADVTADATFEPAELTASGTYTVTASYGGMNDTIDVNVNLYDEVLAADGETLLVAVEAFSQGATALEVSWDDSAEAVLDATELYTDYVVYDLALTNPGETTQYAMTLVDNMDTTNLAVYHVADDGTLTLVKHTIENDCVVFTTSLTGAFAYGSIAVPEGFTLSSITLENIPTDLFVGGSLDLLDAVITAIYTKEGEDDYTRQLTVNDYDENNWSGYDVNTVGAQVAVFTYEGVTAELNIHVWGDEFTVDNVTVHVGEGDYGVTAVNVVESTNVHVPAAAAQVITGDNYVAYDIELVFEEGYSEKTTTKTVTLPIPEGVNNPVVYYVSDDGTEVDNMNAVKDGNGNVTFETTHFSTYVIGESAEIKVPENETATDNVTTGGGTKTVYVLTSNISAGNSYLIANSNSASTTTRYLLARDGSSIAATGVTIKSGDVDGDGDSETYIELDDASDELWTFSASIGSSTSSTLKNGNYYLYAGSNGGLSLQNSTGNYTSWRLNNNSLYRYRRNYTSYYLRYNNGWTTTSSSSSASSIYFYVPTNIDTSSTKSGTYSIDGEDITVAVSEGSQADLTSTLTFTPDENNTATVESPVDVSKTATYEIVTVDANGNTVDGDPNDIISEIENGVVTFTGNYGTALVKVSYTTDFGEVTDYITIKATAPYYSIDLCEPVTDADGNTTYESITDPIALKGIEAGDTYSVWAVIKEHNSENPEGEDLGDVADDSIYWVVSDPSIATVDPKTGVITFTGNQYGTFTVTAHYLDANGNSLCEDTVTISATKSQYVVPGDGTDDFPEYPDQGAIRFDKTAVAQGNFSQTGIAKVELSMTGVPYGTNAKTDVVIMVDMTASMSDDDVTAAELAVQELIKSLVYDEENDKYDSNIQLFIDVFYSASSDSSFATEEYLNCVTISNATELTEAQNKIDFTQSSQGGGTRYNLAMADVYATLNRDGHADNQFVVFVSDGVATAYAPLTDGTKGDTITGSNSETASLAAGWFDDEGEVTDEFETEYYSYLIKTAGIPIYTVGANLTALSDAADVLNHMSSNYSPDGKTSTGESKYSFFCTTSGGITDEVLEIFHGIGQDIREAATNVVVEDKIASEYTINFSLPEGVTATEAEMEDFYIQVLGYELDENNDRKEDPTVLEKFLFSANGTITHTIGATTCDGCTHVSKEGDKITGIDGTYFDYTIDANGDEFLTWTADKLDRTELALEYFVYLDNSAGNVAASNQVDPGTYPTNEYATITYINFNGKECQQEFPVPQMTWMGAQVTYVFYLVNEAGQPVNRAGKIIPFAESIYVTTPVTIDVTWNEMEGSENMLAENLLAFAKVPEVYSLYDEQAYYEIRVYQTEGVDSATQAKNYNYFIIEGSDEVSNKETTKVFNTKAGNRYDDYGAYSATAGNYTSHNSNNSYSATVTSGIDYANTTVAFAVVWKPELVPDVVVVDYGLDVVIDVTENDALASGVTGVSTTAPNVDINKGTYKESTMGTSAEILIDDLIVGTAKTENLTSVRFSLNKNSGMQFSEPVEFFYESACNYYTYVDEERTLNTVNMYSSVTVIPATTVYYEDSYVDLKVYTDADDELYTGTERVWKTEGTAMNAVQATDRPGVNKISEAYDADNNYGYDGAYTNMSVHSMGSARKLTVDSTYFGTAEFTFYGTGFDVISTTSNLTGTIVVQVANEAGESVRSKIVDTYYGYKLTDGEWEVTTNDPNALYQVPVITVEDLDYGKYTVTITAAYNSFFAHNGAPSYDIYLDAIRIYDPTGNENTVANDAYVKDGEGWPSYFEVRNEVIDATTFRSLTADDTISGMVFIDGGNAGADTTVSVDDYTSYGPNNELYLAHGDAVTFDLNATAEAGAVAKVQLAVKTVGGTGTVEVYSVTNDTKTTCLNEEITTATDLYYDITALNGKTVVIKNAGTDGIISITNVKVTYTEAQPEAAAEPAVAMFSVRRASVDAALMTMSVEDTEVEETVPETTVPEETEPETTVPETTVPEETEPEETVPETTVPEETEPVDPAEQIKEIIQNVVNQIVNALSNLFSKWFR